MVSNLYRWLMAAAWLCAALVAGDPAAHAGPAMSYYTDTVEYDQQTCMARARNALTADGWQGIHGNDRSLSADRGRLSAVVICLEESYTQSIGMVTVAGGDDGDAATESRRLKQMVFGE